MALRRELLSYLGTGTMGAVCGYYARAKGLLGLKTSETEPGKEPETPTSSQYKFKLDFESPPEKFKPYIQEVNGENKLVLNDSTIEYELPDLETWEEIEYRMAGKSMANTVIGIDSSSGGSYSSFLGIRPYMRWRTAVEDWNGGQMYPNIDWEDAQPNTEYRVVINRTGKTTGKVRVYTNEERKYTLETEEIFNIFDNNNSMEFIPSKIRFSSNEGGYYGNIYIK